jgi:hypothetical protein
MMFWKRKERTVAIIHTEVEILDDTHDVVFFMILMVGFHP